MELHSCKLTELSLKQKREFAGIGNFALNGVTTSMLMTTPLPLSYLRRGSLATERTLVTVIPHCRVMFGLHFLFGKQTLSNISSRLNPTDDRVLYVEVAMWY